jgi:hypothetical protein
MQTIVTSQQTNHFAQFGWIEFEKFLSADECAAIRSAISETVAQRLHIEVKKLSRCPEKQLYQTARDCWRSAPQLKHLFCSKRLVSTAASLTNKQSMLLACDQWIPPGITLDPLHLNDHLSYQNLICGALLILEGDLAGHARFFHPDRLPITAASQIIIAYGSIQTVYIHNPMDPCNSDLKRLGYSFGDRLNTDHNPFCKG